MIEITAEKAVFVTAGLFVIGMAVGGRVTVALLKYYGNLTGVSDGSCFDYKNDEERRRMNGNEIKEPEDYQG